MEEYQLSPHVRFIKDAESGLALVYHSLYGNSRVLNDEAQKFLELFERPKSPADIQQICDGDPDEIISEFRELLFLITPGTNEKQALLERRVSHLQGVTAKKTIDRMGLAISDSCNFGCAHCLHFQPEVTSRLPLSEYRVPFPQLNMSWETAKKCVDRYAGLMRSHDRTHCRIHFGNAEPLINWPVIEQVLNYCGTMTDLTFDFAINTNLVLMTRDMASTMKKHGVRIPTSLDGTVQANDSIRVTKGGQGTFQQIVAKFDLLDEIGYPLDGFSITVTAGNFDSIGEDIIDLAAARNMKSIAFDYDLVSLVDVPLAHRVQKLMRLKRYANTRGIDFFGTWDSVFRNLTSESLLVGTHAFCAAVEGRSLEFSVDGSVKVCSHTTTKVGHIDWFDAMFIEGGGLFQMVKERFPGVDDYCVGCDVEGSCGGQCHVTREVAARVAGQERQRLFSDMCNFYREVTRGLALDYLRTSAKPVNTQTRPCTI